MKDRKKSKQWLFFVGIALLVQVIVLLLIKPGFFLSSKRAVSESSESAGATPFPDAIITIPIVITDVSDDVAEQPERNVEEEPPDEERDQDPIQPRPARGSPQTSLNVESLVGESPEALPQGPGLETIEIPPRPVQITWPDTRELKHCLEHDINIRIEVDVSGKILRVEALDRDPPSDCIEAALQAARQIVFEPGMIDGAPAKMWTQVRIDFKRVR